MDITVIKYVQDYHAKWKATTLITTKFLVHFANIVSSLGVSCALYLSITKH